MTVMMEVSHFETGYCSIYILFDSARYSIDAKAFAWCSFFFNVSREVDLIISFVGACREEEEKKKRNVKIKKKA